MSRVSPAILERLDLHMEEPTMREDITHVVLDMHQDSIRAGGFATGSFARRTPHPPRPPADRKYWKRSSWEQRAGLDNPVFPGE